VLVFAIAFGAVMGWGLGRRAEDRRPTMVATVFGTATGALCWIVAAATDSPPDGALAVAAVSLTAGVGAALVSLAVTGRRPAA
jgi:hypothetical protein